MKVIPLRLSVPAERNKCRLKLLASSVSRLVPGPLMVKPLSIRISLPLIEIIRGVLKKTESKQIAPPAGGAICFDSVFFSTPRIISMSGSEILIDKGLTISGPGTSLLTLDANNLSRHLFLSAGTLNLSGMTFIHGNTNGSDPQQGSGGSILANSGTTLSASNLAITGGSTPEGVGG